MNELENRVSNLEQQIKKEQAINKWLLKTYNIWMDTLCEVSKDETHRANITLEEILNESLYD